MQRRSVLKSIASAVAGAGLITGGMDAEETAEAQAATNTTSGKKSRLQPSIETVDGTGLFCRSWGTGRPAVFVTPWGLNCDWFEYQMTYLASQGFRCIGYDRRGHGRSGEPVSGYDFNTLADDLATLIQKLDLHDVMLVGHSMGGGEVVRYLSRHGAGRIGRIVLLAPITPFLLKTDDNPDGFAPAMLEKVREMLCKDRPHVIAAAAPAFFNAPKNSVSTEMMAWWTEMLLQCPLKVLLDLHRMFTETDFRGELAKIKSPTLIIQGDSDTSTPIDLTGRKTAAFIQGSQLKVYADAAHGFPITHADRLNSDLLAVAKA
jgi:non-heme chloroperoxidase